MKYSVTRFPGCKLALAAAVLCVTSLVAGANPQTNAPAKPAGTNAPAVAAPSQSVFLVPRTPQDGRDPFFPKSTYIYGHIVVAVQTNLTPTTTVAPRAELKLQGFSGSSGHRLAIINGRTFETGEEAEVPTTGGRVPIRCLEIKADYVVVQDGAERRELKMRGGL